MVERRGTCETCKNWLNGVGCGKYCDSEYSGWEPKESVLEGSIHGGQRNCETCGNNIYEYLKCAVPCEGFSAWTAKDGKSDSILDNPKIVAGLNALFNPENHLSDTQKRITEICDEIKNVLLEKNRKYGDSALNPKRVFSKASPIEQINVRIDDKISRIMSAQDDDTEDAELDLIGYLILKRVAKSVEEGK